MKTFELCDERLPRMVEPFVKMRFGCFAGHLPSVPVEDATAVAGEALSNCSSFVIVIGVDWQHGSEHMWERHGVAVPEASEALADADALWFDPDPHGRSGRGVRVIGYSHSRRAILTIILVHRDDAEGYWGANGWEANAADRRRYERGE